MKRVARLLGPLKGQIQFMRHIAKCYNSHLSIRKKLSASGLVNPQTRAITLKRDKDILLAFFHELGHLQAMEAGVYKHYYALNWEKLPIDYIYRAECDADRRGKRLMTAYFPDLKYDAWYIKNPKVAKKGLRIWFNL